MRRFIALTAAGLIGVTAIAAGPQAAPPEPMHNVELEIGDTVVVDGNADTFGTSLVNVANSDTNYACEGTVDAQCEVVLVKVTNEYQEENAKKGRERANLNVVLDFGTFGATGFSATDMAIQVFESSEDGERGAVVGTADNNPPDAPESMTLVVTSDAETEVQWFRFELIYGAHGGGYQATFDFVQ